jgi:hypothetical protein
MDIAQPAMPSSMSPLGREDHKVEGARLFDFEPVTSR